MESEHEERRVRHPDAANWPDWTCFRASGQRSQELFSVRRRRKKNLNHKTFQTIWNHFFTFLIFFTCRVANVFLPRVSSLHTEGTEQKKRAPAVAHWGSKHHSQGNKLHWDHLNRTTKQQRSGQKAFLSFQAPNTGKIKHLVSHFSFYLSPKKNTSRFTTWTFLLSVS